MATKIVIFKEKHADDVYDITDPEKRKTVFMEKVKERLADGYWYIREDTEDEQWWNVLNTLEKFSPEEARNKIFKKMGAYEWLMHERSNYEYEGYEIIEAQ